MSRRLWPSALLMLAGCQVLPMQSIDCAASGRCTPVSFVLGQLDATQNSNLRVGMNQPLDTLVVAGKLFVADCRNNRVLVWKTVPIFNNQPADYVLGQPDFNTNLASYGGISARSMSCPGSLAFGVDKKLGRSHLIVGDRGNGRVLIWNSIPDASYAPADVVVGQTEVTSGGSNNRPTASMLTDPSVTVSDDGKLIVADQMNSRVLIWNDIPQQDGQAANLVLGQPDLNSGSPDNLALMPSPNPAAWLDGPFGNPSADSTSILVPDTSNDRVLLWTTFPTTNGQSATQVLGQASVGAVVKNAAVSARTLNGPAGLSRRNNQLLVADQLNSRVLLWNLPLPAMPIPPPAAADLVLGQTDFTSRSDNTVALGAATLSRPHSAYSDGAHLIVADSDNNRVPNGNYTSPIRTHIA